MPSHDHWCVPLCTNRQDRYTNLSFNTFSREAKKVSALGSSLPIGDMKGPNTSHFSQRCCLQRALLAYRLPALDKVWRGRGGLSSALTRSRGWDKGQFRRSFRTSECRSCARRLTNVDKKLMSDSIVCLWLLVVQSFGPLPLEATLRKANSLSSPMICVSVMISPPPHPPPPTPLSLSLLSLSLNLSI